MRARATELEEREAGLKRDLNGIPTDDGPDHHEIARTLAALDAIPAQAAKAVGEARGVAWGDHRRGRGGEGTMPGRGRPSNRQAIGWPGTRRWSRPSSEAVGSARKLAGEGRALVGEV